MTNVEELQAASILDPASLTQDERDKINALSADEVNALKMVRQQVGDFSEQGHPHGRPWIL